ncbi:MAG: hypothetical protein J6K84_01270 [Oscillospiraceae bacterium]|nr:hypothetical protein [Oscillospiraceae bacterium]
MKKVLASFVALLMAFGCIGCAATCAHEWSPATCTMPATCQNCGEATGSALGHNYHNATCTTAEKCSICGEEQGTPLGHQYVSGYCIRCNEKDPDYVEYGTLTGTITYKYNNYIGHRGDTGAVIFLIPKNTKSLPDGIGLGLTSYAKDGIFATKAGGNGSYTINQVPAGEYYVVVISNNTNDNPSRVADYNTWGPTILMFSEKGKTNAMTTAKVNKIRHGSVTIYGNRSADYSYDFGITYI